jgi:WD40 repeat protein
MDGTIILWNVANGQIVHKFSSTGYIDSVSFSPDGAMIAVGADGLFAALYITVWDIANHVSFSEDRTINL